MSDPIRYGSSRDFDSGVRWAVYSRADYDACNSVDSAAEELTGWTAVDCSAGGWFWCEPLVRWVGSRKVLVSQRGALDI